MSCCGRKPKPQKQQQNRRQQQYEVDTIRNDFSEIFLIKNERHIVNVSENCIKIHKVSNPNKNFIQLTLDNNLVFDPIYQPQIIKDGNKVQDILLQQSFDRGKYKSDYSLENLVQEQVVGISISIIGMNQQQEMVIQDSIHMIEQDQGRSNLSEQLIKILQNKVCQLNFRTQYKLIEELGGGSSAIVYLAVERKTNIKYAAKVSSKEQLARDKNGIEALFQEIDLMRNLEHKYVIQLKQSFQDLNHIYIVTELQRGGTLKSKIKDWQKKKENPGQQKTPSIPRLSDANKYTSYPFMQQKVMDIQDILIQVLQGLDYIHSQGIMHRDIKPENLLYNDEECQNLVISDFGLGTRLDVKKYLFSRAGTPSYCSPEIYNAKSNSRYTEACDIYSLGLVLYEMVFDGLPFQSHQQHKQYLASQEPLLPYKNVSQHLPKQFPQSTLDLITRMTELDPEIRINAKQALNHEFLKQRMDMHTYENSASTNETQQELRNHLRNFSIGGNNNQFNGGGGHVRTPSNPSSTTLEFVTHPKIELKNMNGLKNCQFDKSISITTQTFIPRKADEHNQSHQQKIGQMQDKEKQSQLNEIFQQSVQKSQQDIPHYDKYAVKNNPKLKKLRDETELMEVEEESSKISQNLKKSVIRQESKNKFGQDSHITKSYIGKSQLVKSQLDKSQRNKTNFNTNTNVTSQDGDQEIKEEGLRQNVSLYKSSAFIKADGLIKSKIIPKDNGNNKKQQQQNKNNVLVFNQPGLDILKQSQKQD